jgi:NAD(P)-dependent dehydrogenase (short-subunit alcohol dehydrogenase family)
MDELECLDEFVGMVAFVTAAAGDGIGHAVARRLARGGASVAVTDAHIGRLERVTRALGDEFGDRIQGWVLEVGDHSQIDRTLEEVREKLGPVNLLVNNAARTVIGNILNYPLDEFERLINLDLVAPWYLSMRASAHMQELGGGAIVNISSVAPETGFADIEPPYAAAKAGIGALSRGFAKAGGKHNIRCNNVKMGMIVGTRFANDNPQLVPSTEDVPLGRHPTPLDIAEVVAFLLSNRSSLITGETLTVGGGAYFGI